MDEVTLIQNATQGDLESFNLLVLTYQDQVFTQAYRMLGDGDSAADATQETFILAFRNIKSYRGGSFRSWLLRIAVNASYTELRRRHRHPIYPYEPDSRDGDEIESARWMADPSEGPEAATLRSELSDAIQHCLNSLPPEFRAAVILVDVQGFDYREAAEITKKPVGTIKSRLARARFRLRECLQGFWELLPAAFRLGMERPI